MRYELRRQMVMGRVFTQEGIKHIPLWVRTGLQFPFLDALTLDATAIPPLAVGVGVQSARNVCVAQPVRNKN